MPPAAGRIATTLELQPSKPSSLYRAAGVGVFKACMDPMCLTCLARGNANRVRVGLCAFEGFESFHVAPALAPSLVDHILGFMSLSQVVCILLVLLALARHCAGRARAARLAQRASRPGA